MESELDKIKGLEESIQTYVERHPKSKVGVIYDKLYHTEEKHFFRDGMKITIELTHNSIREI